jgi:glycosyltransferase involved in cell wall biosynthesis
VFLEPYYGGSHQTFIEGLLKLPLDFTVHTLPANRWKWRMRLAAPFFARQIKRGEIDLCKARAIACSSFLDVAAFKGLLPFAKQHLPLHVYFHENQFAYPVQKEDLRDVHFALTNLTTALSADSLAFNSAYNLESFLSGCQNLLVKIDDMDLAGYQDEIRAKSRILHPGLDFAEIDRIAAGRESSVIPVIVWNHRWEYDKDPDFFFNTLFTLKAEGVAFKLIVLGESFRQKPKVFAEAQQILADRILHFGYVSSQAEYLTLLAKADLVVSTARHEFFGLSVLEAVRAGCCPLLPRRLVYPELFHDEFLYEDHEFAAKLQFFLKHKRLHRQQAHDLTENFSWQHLRPGYEDWLA